MSETAHLVLISTVMYFYTISNFSNPLALSKLYKCVSSWPSAYFHPQIIGILSGRSLRKSYQMYALSSLKMLLLLTLEYRALPHCSFRR